MITLVVLMSTFGLGMCFALLGSISVKLMPRLQIDQGKFGNLISAFMFSCLVSSLVIGVVSDKIGFQPVAVIGFFLTVACILILAYGKSYMTVLLPCLLLGFGAMAMNTAGNVLAPQVLYNGENPAAASNLANVFFGLGLFLTPLIVSLLFNKTTYEKAVSALAVLLLVPGVIAFMATGYPDSNAAFDFAGSVKLLSQPAVIVAGLLLFCYISLEATFCNWLPSYGKEVIKSETPDMEEQSADTSAQRLLSLFAIAMMVGRLVMSFVVKPGMGHLFIAGAAVVMLIVVFLMTNTKSSGQARIMAVLAGFFFGPCFPTTLGVIFSKYSSDVHGTIFGTIFAVGLAGAVIVPNAIGKLSKGGSIQKSLKLLLPLCIGLIVMALVLGNIGSASADKPADVKDGDTATTVVEQAGTVADEAETIINEQTTEQKND